MRTGERFFFVVEPLVSDQVAVPNVSFATLRTAMRLGASMNVQMAGQVTALNERLSANVTLESLILL